MLVVVLLFGQSNLWAAPPPPDKTNTPILSLFLNLTEISLDDYNLGLEFYVHPKLSAVTRFRCFKPEEDFAYGFNIQRQFISGNLGLRYSFASPLYQLFDPERRYIASKYQENRGFPLFVEVAANYERAYFKVTSGETFDEVIEADAFSLIGTIGTRMYISRAFVEASLSYPYQIAGTLEINQFRPAVLIGWTF